MPLYSDKTASKSRLKGAVLCIETKIDLPGVGQNLRDHAAVFMQYESSAQHPEMIPALQVGMRYTTPGSKYRNDMQMRPIQLRSEHIPTDYEITEGKIPTGFSIALQKALSKGEIKLTSSDPAQQPILNYCYLTHPYDLERMRGAVRLCSEISARPEYEPAMMSRMSPSDEILENDEKLISLVEKMSKDSGSLPIEEIIQTTEAIMDEMKDILETREEILR